MVVASIGTWSGPAASTLAPNLYGAQLWVRSINDRGGLGGHPVKLIAYDDGFDPARNRAQTQEAIEQRHAIALLSLATAVHTDDAVNYVTRKRVPVIGSFGGVAGFYQSPMYFPQQSHFEPLYNSWVQSTAAQLVPLGKRKIGITYCSETPLCADIAREFSAAAPGLGLQLVYQGQGSIAQPDYTAECLSARNAGAEAMVAILDGNSVNRYTTSCARQGYKPTYMLVASVILDRHKEDPNLDGAFGVTNVFPWFEAGTPGSDEYQRALSAYGKGIANGVGLATGWAAGKLLEAAGAGLPEPPTSEGILDGLWSIKANDLGGLTMPLSFTREQPAKPAVCWWNLQIRNGAWVSPDGYRRHCL
ncbi:MAG TPA: ABC transporter substrate-binding protein [Acidimicrobiia bacterium]|nr:ABC transporter substrate-binding protein [Acidimicrobiia bacterium]